VKQAENPKTHAGRVHEIKWEIPNESNPERVAVGETNAPPFYEVVKA
jgi:hypothetical protein